MSSIFNDPEWEQQRKEMLSNWARRDGEVKVDMGETEEYMPAEEFLALRQKYPNGNMRLSEPQEAVKVFKDKGLPLPAELSFAGSVKPIFGQEDAYNGSASFPAETFNFPANANEGYQAGLGFSPVVSAMQMPEDGRTNIRLKTRDDLEPMYESNGIKNTFLELEDKFPIIKKVATVAEGAFPIIQKVNKDVNLLEILINSIKKEKNKDVEYYKNYYPVQDFKDSPIFKNPEYGNKTAAILDEKYKNYDSGIKNKWVNLNKVKEPFHSILVQKDYINPGNKIDKLLAVGDFARAAFSLDANALIGSDKFEHCRANYDATKRGPNGLEAAKDLSDLREYGNQLGTPYFKFVKFLTSKNAKKEFDTFTRSVKEKYNLSDEELSPLLISILFFNIKLDQLRNEEKIESFYDNIANERGRMGAQAGLSLFETCPRDVKVYYKDGTNDDFRNYILNKNK